MFRNLSKTTKIFIILIFIVFVVMIIMISISGNKTSKPIQMSYISDNASADNKVEALKMMTADLINVENKNQKLQKMVEHLGSYNENLVNELRKSVSNQLKTALKKNKLQNSRQNKIFEEQLEQKEALNQKNYQINMNSGNNSFVWVSDLSHLRQENILSIKTKPSENLFKLDNSESLLHGKNNYYKSIKSLKRKKSIKPIYTIPMNATLTGATLMTPLIGRVPIDGKLQSPYHFKLVLSAKNLTANGYPLPTVKGAIMSGIASGDMLGGCARGNVHSITFIFSDGTISTIKSTDHHDSLGYISTQTGNPCITGTFHSDAGIFLGAQIALSAAEGYANALSTSQYINSSSSEGKTIRTLIGNANKAGIGQGVSAASQAAQTWWNRRVQNSFDYVYVSNFDHKTRKTMKVVVNITQQISINYDPNGRKVNYEDTQINNSNLD